MDYDALPSTEIEIEVPEGNILGVMEGKETPPVELSAEFSHAWADPIGIAAATLRAAQQSPEKYRDLIVVWPGTATTSAT